MYLFQNMLMKWRGIGQANQKHLVSRWVDKCLISLSLLYSTSQHVKSHWMRPQKRSTSFSKQITPLTVAQLLMSGRKHPLDPPPWSTGLKTTSAQAHGLPSLFRCSNGCTWPCSFTAGWVVSHARPVRAWAALITKKAWRMRKREARHSHSKSP